MEKLLDLLAHVVLVIFALSGIGAVLFGCAFTIIREPKLTLITVGLLFGFLLIVWSIKRLENKYF